MDWRRFSAAPKNSYKFYILCKVCWDSIERKIIIIACFPDGWERGSYHEILEGLIIINKSRSSCQFPFDLSSEAISI